MRSCYKIISMKCIYVATMFVCMFIACTNAGQETAAVPPAPKSVQDITAAIKGKKYQVSKLGLMSPFASDSLNPVNWKVQEQDTSAFFRKYVTRQTGFTIAFNTDSLADFMDIDADKMVKAVYTVENDTNPEDEEEQAGYKIKLSYNDSMEFAGNKTAAKMTLSLRVTGIDAANLLLETNRSYNNRKMVLWMRAY
jgi:hypothetical protein